jgi:hypothetical protein
MTKNRSIILQAAPPRPIEYHEPCPCS